MLSDREKLLDAVDVISSYTNAAFHADISTNYSVAKTYQNLINDIRDFMKDVGLFREEDWDW